MSDPSTYEIGWMCCLESEYQAARAFLDEIHPPPAWPEANFRLSEYTLGSIGESKVVIGVPLSRLSTNTFASSVGYSMLCDFPNLRLAVSIGTCGGAAEAHNDIHLGDVFVSAPACSPGGIFQFDLGKRIESQGFLARGEVRKSPPYWQAAIDQVEVDIDRHEGYLANVVDQILEREPTLAEDYSRPDPGTDILYCDDCRGLEATNESCVRGCDATDTGLVRRDHPSREHPRVHYGRLASAMAPVSNARLRDELTAEGDVVCFDTSAAGALKGLPCLIVRGISHYGDSLTNPSWQGYAALVAAAYAKEVFPRVSSNGLLPWAELLRENYAGNDTLEIILQHYQ